MLTATPSSPTEDPGGSATYLFMSGRRNTEKSLLIQNIVPYLKTRENFRTRAFNKWLTSKSPVPLGCAYAPRHCPIICLFALSSIFCYFFTLELTTIGYISRTSLTSWLLVRFGQWETLVVMKKRDAIVSTLQTPALADLSLLKLDWEIQVRT